MKVTIHFMGQVRHAAGLAAAHELELPGPCSVLECLRLLTAGADARLRTFLLDEKGQVQRTILLFVGQEQVRDADRVMLHEGDALTLLSPIAGG